MESLFLVVSLLICISGALFYACISRIDVNEKKKKMLCGIVAVAYLIIIIGLLVVYIKFT